MQRGPDFMKHGVVADSVGGKRKSVIANLQICVTNDDEDTTFLLKVLYCIVARESVPVPPMRTAIAWHPSSITSVAWFGTVNALAQD